jgi:hemoglobin-like flavoprotein
MSKRALAASLLLASLICSPVRADSVQDLQALVKQGQLSQALEKADQLLASKPRDAQVRFLRGVILSELNRGGEAITVFQKLTEDYPELPEPYNNLAVLYAQQRQYDKARNALEMAIRTHPSYATAHENLGDIYARLASQAYDKALALDSSNVVAQNKLALIREMMSVGGKTVRPAAPGGRQARRPTVAAAPPRPSRPRPSRCSRRHRGGACSGRQAWPPPGGTAPAAKPAAPAPAAVARPGRQAAPRKPSAPSPRTKRLPRPPRSARPSRAGPAPGRARTSKPISALRP